MRRIRVHLLLAFSLLVTLTLNCDARAGELKLLVTNGTRSIVDMLRPQFEQATGHKLPQNGPPQAMDTTVRQPGHDTC